METRAERADVPKVTVAQRAIDRIKSMIGEGTLEPGQRLPTERELAAQLGISRSSMREAIRALTVMGVLESRHGSGVYVTQLDAGGLLEAFGAVAGLSPGPRLLELLEVRRVLESSATGLAAARIGPEQLAEVEQHLKAMEMSSDPEEILAHDLAFHRAIATASGNESMAAVLDGLSSKTFRTRVWRGYEEESAFERTHLEHTRIYEALIDRDPESARAASSVHVAGVERWLRRQLDHG
ncbi:FadR/GntR family transcriptional regulator [Streptomyces inhibens]|uniref:FadR/GntR family transcriptional regulator n=1 Tax=Streptomyces inhibens TaxID=2293571 RepID=UPI001EE6A7A2|nr:FadR/GntR family transcriptional regulator [Streptomyces inhibens]UKY48587.1 FadR family transcriptional regulator [Streptomyces inhibens]